MEPKPASPKKNTLWVWVVVALVVLCLCCFVVIIGAGAYAAWKGYIALPAINLPGLPSPAIPTPKTLPKAIPTGTPNKIMVEPYQPQTGDDYPTLQNLAPNWQNPTGPGTHTYDIAVNTNQSVLLASGWCTTTQTILNQNFQHIQYLVEVDGQSLNTDSLSQEEQQSLGQTCKDFAGIIRAWPAGKHTLKITMRLDAKINDGWNDYPAGDYVEIYNVTAKP
ncbi:MAG: hypothetical protein ABSF99_04795 [Anaerolineales bacterium]